MCFRLLPDNSFCQKGKQVEIITKMIFELCYIEAIIGIKADMKYGSNHVAYDRF